MSPPSTSDLSRVLPRAIDAAIGGLVVAAAALFVGIALLSLRWGVEHDTPFFAYLGFLTGHEHFVPYRDVYEINLPGTFLAFAALDGMFGASDFGFRCADLVLLATLTGITWSWMRPFGWKPAVAGPALFGLNYLHDGSTLCLQREFFMVLFFSAAIGFAAGLPRLDLRWRAIGAGLFTGLALLIKPQALLVAPILALFLCTEPASEPVPAGAPRRCVPRLAAASLMLAGVALPWAVVAAWLAAAGALDEFVEIARNYWPLFAHLDGLHETIEPSERGGYLLTGWRVLGGLHLWLIPAALGWLVASLAAGSPERRRLSGLLAALALAASLMPLVSGQFFPYHWLPLFYFLALLGSLSLTAPAPRVPPLVRAAAIGALLFAGLTEIPIADEVRRQVSGQPLHRALDERVEAIRGYLSAHLEPGDTVQPLDWTGGSVDAMWRARARLATRFMSDFYFYHHVSRPYIQRLRRRFIEDLGRARPKVIVEIETLKPWVKGKDTTREFPELRAFIERQYVRDLEGDGFVIYLRRAPK